MVLRLGLTILALGLPASTFAAEPAKPSFTKQVAPLLTQYCARCHTGAKARADIAFDRFKDEATAKENPVLWERVGQVLRAHEMPPARRPQPTAGEVKQITAWIDSLASAGACIGKRDPGQVTIRRLNRTEYNNTVRDLLGVAFHPADDFPADDVGYGFDNMGDVLSLSTLLMEKYLAAAEKIVPTALADPETRKRIFICQPTPGTHDSCARKILEAFARRAYRRPVAGEEVERLVALVRLAESQRDGFDKGIELALEAVLTSPQFLFRVERDFKSRVSGPHLITEYELAARLSYFLWSSMPDDELFAEAQRGTLRKNLESQVRRMLKDDKAKALVENFAGQWLQLRNLRNASPDPGTFPSWDEPLRVAMQKETELFFHAVLSEDRNIIDFVDADFTFVNERLARHYGIPGIKGQEFQRVHLTDRRRGGVLTQASILTLTSNPTRTSPVKRGKWILENILGTPPPPPPPGAGELSDDKQVVLSGSLRQRMEQHRAKPDCAICHKRMDPLGFGFENFDAIGGWREKDGAFTIDSSGVLPDGRSFQGPAELRAILLTQRDAFARCLTEKMLTYALGRGLETYDKCAVGAITAALGKSGYRLPALIVEICKSDPLQMRRGKGGQKG
jgi:Protein of unknown function (DUF1592)/Protein of unknown function (DUF1588)/Protein of unknown function (DUF1587)/Protein of unknown function (DUF1585)/Protein of unknown function (DUF1595)